jgi:1,2-diacylglycerol 3-beta-glucosyltransferase
MRTRVVAAGILLASAAVGWLTIAAPFAARILQLLVLVSMGYVAWLAWRGSRAIRRALTGRRSGAGEPTGLARGGPFVSLVLPARDEASVIGPTVDNLRDLRYADADRHQAYELLIVDDGSTDATGEIAAAAAGAAGHVSVRRREPGTGPRTKGAALAFAMPYLRGDVIGVIDADTRVEPAFLERVVRAWERDPSADALQVGRPPRNAAVSWLTRAQAEEQLMDLTSQCGRWATDGTAELRGNGMFVRREALEALGGWNEHALTEDLDLSTRLEADGRHVTMAPEIAVDEEAVETLGALWHQRMRWAEGSLRRLLDHGPGLVLGPQPIGRKVDFMIFTTEFLVPPLFVATTLASLVTTALPRPADWSVPAILAAGYGLGVFMLALGGLSAFGERGARLVARSVRGALFLSHWLVIIPFALVRITVGPERTTFTQTPRFSSGRE